MASSEFGHSRASLKTDLIEPDSPRCRAGSCIYMTLLEVTQGDSDGMFGILYRPSDASHDLE